MELFSKCVWNRLDAAGRSVNTQALLSLACERGEVGGGGRGELVMQPILVHNICSET